MALDGGSAWQVPDGDGIIGGVAMRWRPRSGVVDAAVLAWAVAIVAMPWLVHAGRLGRALAGLVYLAGSMVCHQLADRTFHVAGHQMPVCARCVGLYAGAAVGVLAWRCVHRWVGRPSAARLAGRWARAAVIAAATPTALTLLTGAAGWWDPSNAVRFAVAMPLGAAAGAVVLAVAAGDLR